MKTKRGSRSHVDIPPLYISGRDDCASFFTMLLNRDYHNDTKHPILLSRLGPFRNAVQKSLTHSRRWVQEDIGHIELRGSILPCAVTALLRATTMCMQQKHDEASLEDVVLPNNMGLGSHYFVIQTKSIIQNATYSWNSQSNLSVPMNSCLTDDEDTISDVSSRQRGADVFVWDISKPNVTTFKMTSTEN